MELDVPVDVNVEMDVPVNIDTKVDSTVTAEMQSSSSSGPPETPDSPNPYTLDPPLVGLQGGLGPPGEWLQRDCSECSRVGGGLLGYISGGGIRREYGGSGVVV